MPKFIFIFICLSLINLSACGNSPVTDTVNYIAVSQSLLYAVKTGDSSGQYRQQLQRVDENALAQQLTTDDLKKAFWLNIYNSYVQRLLTDNPDRYKSRKSFFGAGLITIAGNKLSLDDIEHGILRHSKTKWSLGHVNKLFAGGFEKKFRVDTVDYRIHFALNCGAKSCPPIAYYTPEKISAQLELATKNYLKNEAEYKANENTVYLPAIMSWFRADFGGKKGMKQILNKYNIIAANADPEIKFKKYDWTLELNNYKTETE